MNTNVYEPPKSDVQSNEPVNLEYAGFWIRALASIIDTVLLIIVLIPLFILIYGIDGLAAEQTSTSPIELFISYVLAPLVVILFWYYKSATPGKMMLKLKVINLNESGPKLGVGQSIGRYVGYYLSSIVLGLGFIWVAFDKKKQGWHDKLAKTAVVRVRAK